MKNSFFLIKNFFAKSANGVRLEIPNLSLDIGKTYALIGRSGNGKTLLTSLLFGFPYKEWTRKGNVRFEKFSVLERCAKAEDFSSNMRIRTWINGDASAILLYMPQQLPVERENNTPIRDEIKYSLKTIVSDLSAEDLRNVYSRFEEKIGNGILDKQTYNLSGGERKRMEILLRICGIKIFFKRNPNARALIILDEPTSGLDLKSEKEFADFIAKIFAEIKSRAALLVATHALYLLGENYFDEAILLDNCRVISQGALQVVKGEINNVFGYSVKE